MRRRVIGVVLLTAACGGSSTPPTTPTPTTASLTPGLYSLQLSSSGTGCLTIRFGTPPSPAPSPSITVNLNLAADGSGWRGTLADPSQGNLVLTAALTPTLFKGALDGVVSDGSKTVSFTSASHVMAGSPTGTNRFEGGLPDGAVVTFSSPFSEAGVSMVTCPNVVWTLSPK